MCKNHSKYYNIMSWIIPRFWLVYISDLLEDRCIDDVANNSLLRLYYIKQIDSKLPWVCLVIDHRGLSKMKFSFLFRWSNFGYGSRCFICILRFFWWKGRLTEYAVPHVQLFCSHHIFMSSSIYYWTDQQPAWTDQHLGLYLPVKFNLVIIYKEYFI